MAARRRSHFSVPLIERNRALEVRGTRACHPDPRVIKGLPQEASMLNSACQLCFSPRRARRVKRSDRQPGIECPRLRTRRICRRCAFDASQESVSDPGSIDITTTDNSLVIYSVKRCKGRSGIIEGGELIWRKKEESMSHA